MQQLCELHGVLLWYLSAYSPNFNSIELSFYLLKQWIKKDLAMAPKYRSLNCKEIFKVFLFTAIYNFGKNIDYKALFEKCYIKITEISKIIEF